MHASLRKTRTDARFRVSDFVGLRLVTGGTMLPPKTFTPPSSSLKRSAPLDPACLPGPPSHAVKTRRRDACGDDKIADVARRVDDIAEETEILMGERCLGRRIDSATMDALSEHVVTSILDLLEQNGTAKKHVKSSFVYRRVLDFFGVRREVTNCWYRCVKEKGVPAFENSEDGSYLCDAAKLRAWLEPPDEPGESGEPGVDVEDSLSDDVAAEQLLSLTQQTQANEEPNVPVTFAAKGKRWTDEERDAFLRGYEKYGSKWTRISQEFVQTRTPCQVQSHGQKHMEYEKRRRSSAVADSVRSHGVRVARPPYTFAKNDMVWARVGKTDYWPGTIEHANPDLGTYVVRYYQPFGKITNPLPLKNIEPFRNVEREDIFQKRSRRCKSKEFLETLKTALLAEKRALAKLKN